MPISAKAAPLDLDLSGTMTLATEGIGRGYAVTGHKPFYALSVMVQSGGAYASVTTDRFEIAGATNETYIVAGYAHKFGRLTVDGAVIRYLYNAETAPDFWGGAIALRYAVRRATVEIGAIANADYFLHSGRALYTYARVKRPVLTNREISLWLSGTIGRQEVQKNDRIGSPDWTYWNAGASIRYKAIELSLTYHDTDIANALDLPAGPRLVGSLMVGF